MDWMSMASSKGSSWATDGTQVSASPALAGRFFTTEAPGEPGSLKK